jgi:multidrug efflux system membrane fusion protein
MAKVRKSGIAVIAAVLLIAAGGYFILGQVERDKARAAAASATPPGVPVTVGVAEARDVPVFVRGIGTVQAFKAVTVKTRVDGHIVKLLFEEGQEVKEGDPLFQIDPRPFQATLDQAIATKQRDEAQLQGAQLDLERYGKLLAPGFQSRQSYDQQKATVDALKGSIAADQAAIDTARLNLNYADIRAPISGRTGQRLVDLGNLVMTGQSTPLVSITQIKPIFVNFTVPQDQTDKIRTNQTKGPLTVQAYGSDDKTLLAEGKVTLIDNQIDQTTGTLRLKGTFENANERLWPGEFVNVRLVLDTRKDAITVPQRVVLQGAEGYYCYVVKPGNTVERRTVGVAVTQDGIAVISKGLAAGEKVVVDGQYRLSNGARIRIDSKPDAQQPQPQQPGTAASPGAPADEHG